MAKGTSDWGAAEWSALGAAALSKAACLDLLEVGVEPKHFHARNHARIWEAVAACAAKGEFEERLLDALEEHDKNTLICCCEYVMSPANSRYYGETVISNWAKRELRSRAASLAKAIDSGEDWEVLDKRLDRLSLPDARPVRDTLPPITHNGTFEIPELAYLWEPYLPVGVGVLWDARQGTGKTSGCLGIAASLSNGITPVSCEPCEPAHTLYIHADAKSPAEHLEAVYRACGGAPGYLHIIDYARVMSEKLNLKANSRASLDKIASWIKQTNSRLVAIDPLTDLLPGVDLSEMQEVTFAVSPLLSLYAHLQVSGVHLRHAGKGMEGKDPTEVGYGSVAFPKIHAGQLLAQWHPTEKGVIGVQDLKGGLLVPRGETFFYRRTGAYGAVEWIRSLSDPWNKGESRSETGSQFERVRKESAKFELAKSFLLRHVTGQYERVSDLIERASPEGISERTLWRAKNALGVRATRQGFADNQWRWHLPLSDALEPFPDSNPEVLPVMPRIMPSGEIDPFADED